MATRPTAKTARDPQDRRSIERVLQRLDERLGIIERAFEEDDAEGAAAARRWSTDRHEARRRAIARFDYEDMLQRQPEAVKKLRDHYARLNAFLADGGFEPVRNEFTE